MAVLALCTGADAATIADLQATSRRLAEERGRSQNRLGGAPALTKFKHQLRDWVESRIPGTITDPEAFAKALNSELAKAGLFEQKCSSEEIRGNRCDAQNWLGSLGEITATVNQSLLTIEMGTGIFCGTDDSLYAYERSGGQWVRKLASEELDYEDRAYRPRNYDHILVSTPDARGTRKLLTVGRLGWCSSNWHPIHYRYYRIGATAKMLIDGSHSAYVGKDPPAEARLEPDGFLIEFWDLSFGSYSRPLVLRYQMRDERMRRVEPIALRPQDFVEEWVSRPWDEVAEWTNPSARKWHQQVFDPDAGGEYKFVQRCTVERNTWQAAVSLTRRNKTQTLYFLVEDRGEFRYRMRDVSETRQPGCPGESQPDSKAPTLFPQVKKTAK